MKRPLIQSNLPGEASGFVLVGVVIMALALTILGLSLFSLSSYESQFLDRSLARNQAENRALGEIERAKYRLSTTPYLLQNIPTFLPTGVTADASQLQGGVIVSTGPVEWDNDEPVTINATCAVGEVTRSASGRFKLSEAPNYYKRLVTAAGQLVIETEGGTREGTVRLVDADFSPSRYSRVWQNKPDTAAWIAHVDAYTRGVKIGDAPVPTNLRGFIEQPSLPFLARGNFPQGLQTGEFTLAPGAGQEVGYFCHADPDSDGFSYYSQRYLTFLVSGPVVVMFRYGLHLEKMLNIMPNGPNASLTIVAARNKISPPEPPAPPNVGMWLKGGINSPTVPVFLVSDGDVYLQQTATEVENEDTRVASLSVFAPNVILKGPYNPQNHRMWLSYDRNTNALVDWLSDRSALPNTSPAGNHQLALIPGTWQMSTR